MSLTLEPMELESTVNMPDIGDVELSLNPAEDAILRMSMPPGIGERVKEGQELSEGDSKWFSKCLFLATDFSTAELEVMESSVLHYFVISATRLLCRQEMISYYEFMEDYNKTESQKSLMEQGSWQVQDD